MNMKEKILMTVFLSLSIAACQRQPQETDTAQPLNSSSPLAAQLDQAGEKIGKYLDQLDNPKTSQQKRIQILCKDYPTVYKTEYMPALLNLHSNEYTAEGLLFDLDIVLDFYKKGANIEC